MAQFLANQKLFEIHGQIRKDQISSMMKKLRYQVSRSMDEKCIQEIINLPEECFTRAHLDLLLTFVNNDHTNAILHLGNLVIDRRVTYDLLQSAEWKIGQNQKWIWLIRALSEIAYCTPAMFDYSIRRIIAKKSVFSLQHSLEILHKLLKTSKQYTFNYMKMSPQLLIALCNHSHDAQESISNLSLRIISVMTSECQQMPQIILEIVGEKRITKLLLHCFMKLQAQRRILACQIANNFLLSSIFLKQVAMRILQLTQVEKESVKLEISYYFRAFVEKVDEIMLFAFIRDCNLLGILREYSLIKSENPKYDESIIRNALQSMVIITQRFQQTTADLIKKQINRLGVGEMVEAIVDQNEETNIGI